MQHSFGRVIALLTIIAAAPLWAQQPMTAADRQLLSDIRTLTQSKEPFEYSIPLYLNLFRKNNVDGKPGYSVRDRELQILAWVANIRASILEDFLLQDLDGNMIVTADELRVDYTPDAYRYSNPRAPNRSRTPEEAENYIDKAITARLQYDLDGDGALSFDEARIVARDISENARQRVPVPRMAPSLLHDTDGDGIISDTEFLDLARRIFDLFDSNGDTRISVEESVAAQEYRKSPPAFMREATASAREVAGYVCPFPDRGDQTGYYVIGGYEGAAMTDVYLGDRPEAVELVQVKVPRNGNPIRLIVGFQNATILQLDDPGERVRKIYDTRGPIGVIGAPRARLLRIDPSCNLAMWRPISSKNPDPALFYQPLLKRGPIGVLSDYSLGLVDLGLMTNAPRARFSNAIDVDMFGDQSELWTRFARFNPGGLVLIDPASVKFSGTVTRHRIWPQYAGLAQLAAAGKLEILPGNGRMDGVAGSGLEVTIGGTRFRPGGGDDSIKVGDLRYTQERPGTWIGREPLRLRIKQPFSYPAGLTGAHAVTFVLPADVDVPTGDRGHSTLVRESPDTTLEQAD